jgi:hypothetical protein
MLFTNTVFLVFRTPEQVPTGILDDGARPKGLEDHNPES